MTLAILEIREKKSPFINEIKEKKKSKMGMNESSIQIKITINERKFN